MVGRMVYQSRCVPAPLQNTGTSTAALPRSPTSCIPPSPLGERESAFPATLGIATVFSSSSLGTGQPTRGCLMG